MTTVTSRYFREHFAEIFDMVFNGATVVLTYGKGKKAKKIKLTQDQTKPKHMGQALTEYLNSEEFKNRKVPKELQEIDNLDKFYKENYGKDKYAKYFRD